MSDERRTADDYVAAARGELTLLERARFEAELENSPVDREAHRVLKLGLTSAQVSSEAPSKAQLEALIARLDAGSPPRAAEGWAARVASALGMLALFAGGASAAWLALRASIDEPDGGSSSPAEVRRVDGTDREIPAAGASPALRGSADDSPAPEGPPGGAPAEGEAPPGPQAPTASSRRRRSAERRERPVAPREPTEAVASEPNRRLRDGLQGGLPLWSMRSSDLEGLDAGRILALAEDRARSGRREEAEAIYEKALRDSALASHHDFFRYGLARLAMTRDPERAAALFERVAERASPELAAQADLARCELMLSGDRCRVWSCLRAVSDRRPSVSADVERLIARWSLDGCDEGGAP